MAQFASVLLSTRNRPEKLPRAVRAILDSSHVDFELVVVDQSTDDRSQREIESIEDVRLHYIRTPTVGLSRSRNIAIRASRGEIVAFIDDDCICDPHWLAALVAEYERDPAIMSVFGRVAAFGEEPPGMFCPCLMEDRDRRVVEGSAVPQVALGSGNNMSFRRDVFRRVGLFFETLGAGTPMKSGEDTEFTLRVLRAGLRCIYAPEALMYHDNWMPMGEYEVLARAYLLGGSAALVKFALEFDRAASVELARTAYHILRRRKGAGSIPAALGNFLVGCAHGVGYRLTPPPRLATKL